MFGEGRQFSLPSLSTSQWSQIPLRTCKSVCSLPSLSIFPFSLPIYGIQAFPDIINALCLNDVYVHPFNWVHRKLKEDFAVLHSLSPQSGGTSQNCIGNKNVWKKGRSGCQATDQSWGHVSEKWPSDYSTKYHVTVSRTLKGSKCWKSPSPSYWLKHSVVKGRIYAFLIKSHPWHIADNQGQKLRSRLFLLSWHSPGVRWSQTHISHSLIFGAFCSWYLSA